MSTILYNTVTVQPQVITNFCLTITEFQSHDAIFKPTVLETYWEFESRTGTVVKLTVSTFVSAFLFF